MASTYLSKTPSSAGNQKTYTFSCWVKRSALSGGTINGLFVGQNTSATEITGFRFATDDAIEFGTYSGTWDWYLKTNRLFRDTSAWYHIVFAVDTTQATSSDRAKLYINGVQETSFSSSTYPSLNFDTDVNTTNLHVVGAAIFNSVIEHLDGSMAHVHFIDGTAYDASAFGETDATTGIWKPKTAPSVTYGTNGFFLKFENSGSMGTDSSGNANNFTVNGTLTQTEDTPSNVFATLNPLFNSAGYFSGNTQSLSFANGNTYAGKVTHGTYFGTLGVTQGKYYWEVKLDDTNSFVGIISMLPNGGVTHGYQDTTINSYYPFDDALYFNGVGQGSGSGDFDSTSGQTYMFALDATNNKMWYGRNGTWIGDPSAGTGNSWSLSSGYVWTPVFHPAATTQNNNAYFNFGNGYFGTTAVSSAQNPDDGIGIFEYDVPTGYRALCTKSINAEEYS